MEESNYRYQRSREVVEILKQAWSQDQITYKGEVYDFADLTTNPARPYQQNGGPLLYFRRLLSRRARSLRSAL